MVLFVALFPPEDKQHEGSFQRIIAVDNEFSREERAYLYVSHRRFFRHREEEVRPGVILYSCNLLTGLPLILRLFRQAGTIYLHSLVYTLPVLPLLWGIPRTARLVLDAHGLVPEEQEMEGGHLKSRLYGFTERLLFRRLDELVVVTDAMAGYLLRKYPQAQPRVTTYPILPGHILQEDAAITEPDPSQPICVIYSGNTQAWQNVPQMLRIIRQNLSPRVHYHLLTGQPAHMHRLLEEAGLAGEASVTVKQVSPQELKDYYRDAHYGFVLRDDIPVNRVACPTKLVEYLYYGIVPVVSSPHIGDFPELGYEYLAAGEFHAGLPPRKSRRNHLLVKRLLQHRPVLPGMKNKKQPDG